jgi:hypothetical protein
MAYRHRLLLVVPFLLLGGVALMALSIGVPSLDPSGANAAWVCVFLLGLGMAGFGVVLGLGKLDRLVVVLIGRRHGRPFRVHHSEYATREKALAQAGRVDE